MAISYLGMGWDSLVTFLFVSGSFPFGSRGAWEMERGRGD